jgi:hypothetical protein
LLGRSVCLSSLPAVKKDMSLELNFVNNTLIYKNVSLKKDLISKGIRYNLVHCEEVASVIVNSVEN